MDVSRRNLGEVKKFLEQRWEGELEPNIELLLGEKDGIILRFLSRHDLSIHKFHEHTIRDAEAFTELPHIQLIQGFLSVSISRRAR